MNTIYDISYTLYFLNDDCKMENTVCSHQTKVILYCGPVITNCFSEGVLTQKQFLPDQSKGR